MPSECRYRRWHRCPASDAGRPRVAGAVERVGVVQRAHGRIVDQPGGGRSPVHAIGVGGALQRRNQVVDGAAVGGRVAFAV